MITFFLVPALFSFPRSEPVNFLKSAFFRTAFVSNERAIVVPERSCAIVFLTQQRFPASFQKIHRISAWERGARRDGAARTLGFGPQLLPDFAQAGWRGQSGCSRRWRGGQLRVRSGIGRTRAAVERRPRRPESGPPLDCCAIPAQRHPNRSRPQRPA